MRKPTRRWATVQDLRPFLYNEWSRHWTRWGAHAKADRYGQLIVMRVEQVEWLNERLKERDVFERGLEAAARRFGVTRD